MTDHNQPVVGPIDAEAERKKYLDFALKEGRFHRDTYMRDATIDERTTAIFNTFARTLRGRGQLPTETKDAELRALAYMVRQVVVQPLLQRSEMFAASQAAFDEWHATSVASLRVKCRVRRNNGTTLTVGMAQKLINLHCKSLWALDQVPKRSYLHFHATIDDFVLDLLGENPGWTFSDSYTQYMAYQFDIRQLAEAHSTYPVALESWHWYRTSNWTADHRGGAG